MPSPSAIPRLAQAAGLELAARRVVEGLYAGRHRSPYTGPATEFNDHRSYLPGDDLRSVDWKAFGRSDHLLIRRYREERDLPLALVIDTSASMDYGSPAKREWSIVAAAALALLAIDQGDRVRLVSGVAGVDSCSREHGGPAGAMQVLSDLDGLTWRGTSDLARLAGSLGTYLKRRSLIVVISDLLCDPSELAGPLGTLSARGHDLAVLQVLDRSEIALPAEWGLSQLSDPEARTAAFTCDAAAAKAGYDQAMHAHLGACRRILAACQGDHVLAVTDTSVADTLGDWLHRRRRR